MTAVISLSLFLASAAILYYILRYRIHIHIEISGSPSRQRVKASGVHSRTRGGELRAPDDRVRSTATTRPAISKEVMQHRTLDTPAQTSSYLNGAGAVVRPIAPALPSPVTDISSALVGLGAKKDRAQRAAEHVVRNWPDADFDTQFRAAVKEVQAA